MGPPSSHYDNREFSTTKDAARLLNMSPRTLEHLRIVGSGPRYCKAGRRVLYRRSDLIDWLAGRSFASTSEARRAGIV
jgi:hypothetical protein